MGIVLVRTLIIWNGYGSFGCQSQCRRKLLVAFCMKYLYMKKIYFLSVLVLFCLFFSCRHKEYDLSNGIETEMNFGGDSLFIPIGSTDSLFLSQFLEKLDMDLLAILENAGYAIRLSDSAEVEIPELDKNALKVDDIEVSQSQKVLLSEINFDNLSIPGITVEESNKLGLPSMSLSGLTIPNENPPSLDFKAELSKYKMPSLRIPEEDFEIDYDNMFHVSGLDNLTGDAIWGFAEINVPPVKKSNDLSFSIQVPNEVKQIDTIYLEQGARLKVAVELDSLNFLKSGRVLPTITINPSDLFIFDGLSADELAFTEEDSLTLINNFKLEKTFPIRAFMVGNPDGSPVDPVNGYIDVTKNIEVEFSFKVVDATSTLSDARKINTVDLKISTAVENSTIKYLKFDIPEIVLNASQNSNFIFDINLPEQVQKLERVLLKNPSRLLLSLSKKNFADMQGLNINFDKIEIKFPPQFVMDPQSGLTGSTYTLIDYAFTESKKDFTFDVRSLDMSNSSIVNNVVKINEKVEFTGAFSIKGRISSASIPSSPNQDPALSSQFASTLNFASADLEIKEVTEAIPSSKIPIDINVDIDPSIKELMEIKVKESTIKIEIGMPTLTAPLRVDADGIQLKFPPMFKFKNTPPEFNQSTNIYTISGSIPALITLELDRLAINKPLVNGKLSISDSVALLGGVKIPSCAINSSALEGLDAKEIKLKVEVSKILIEEIGLDGIGVDVNDSTTLDIVIADFPKEVYSLDSVTFNGAAMDIRFELKNMPNFNGKPLNANLIIDLPDFIKFGAGQIEAGNKIRIEQDLTNNLWSKHLDILALTFDGKPLDGEFNIQDKITFKGRLEIVDPTINVGDLVGREIEVLVDAKISNLMFSKVYGRVDPNLTPQFISVSLADLPSFLKSDSIVLDIDNPYIDMVAVSNVGIPISADISMNPWVNGAVNEAASQNLSIEFPLSLNPSIDGVKKYWIAKNTIGMPSDYEFKSTQISNIIKRVPDSIQLKVNVKSDLTKQHVIDLNAKYKAKIAYDFVVPLAFGKDFKFAMSDTMGGMDAQLMEMVFNGHSIGLVGEIMNTIPLDLEMTIFPVDSLNRIIPITPPTQKIEAGKYNGEATISQLDVTFSDPSKLMVNVSGFIITFSAKTGKESAGAPIKPSNFIKVSLKAKAFGGVTIKP